MGRAARRASTILALATMLIGAAASPVAPRAAESAPLVPTATSFASFLAALRTDAEARGVSAATFDQAFAGMAPDPSVAALTRAQPEQLKTTGAYLAAQVTPVRVAEGRRIVAQRHDALAADAARFGVPGAIVAAVWGLETNYGASPGGKDVLRSMATLAAMDYRPDLYRTELLAALDLLQSGEVTRAELRGSWAGAMGQPQFMPSSFAKYAVDGDGDGRRDIWTSVPDTLASIANFLHRQGWHAGQPWGFEIELPRGFDLAGPSRAPFADWASRGVSRPDGAPLPVEGDGILYFPAGATGPAFLVTENFEVLKTYNFSDNYALSVGALADRMEGGAAIRAAWPADPPISKADRIALQARLAALGLPVDDRNGRISLALRDTIRLAQKRVGMTPDGNPTAALLRALTKS